MNWQRIRAAIPALSRSIYLNTGTFGPLPSPVAAELHRVYAEIERWGTFAPPVYQEVELAGYELVRQQVADLLNAQPEEIALTRNVTDGINIVLHGLDWQPGDEVILSDQEHASGTVPWLALAERTGVRLRWLHLVPDADTIVDRFRRLLTPRTRLACLSHVSCLTGLRLPVERICTIARQARVLTLIDGAHAEGQLAVDVQAIGCDFYAACGHKWLLGPQGVGMLFVRREWVEQLRPIWLGWGVNQVLDRQAKQYRLEETAARFEQSTRPWPLYLAFGKAIQFIEDIGLPAIQSRVQELRREFVKQLAVLPGITLHSPTDLGLSTGLVTVSVAGWDCQDLSRRLWEQRRIICSSIPDLNALRFSVAFFTSPEELAQVLDLLADAGG